MPNKKSKSSDKNYVFSRFKKDKGSRAEVYHGTAFRTTGGLEKKDLTKNKQGRIVSLKKSRGSKNPDLNPLLKNGLQQPKGSTEFGPKNTVPESNSKSKKSKKSKSKSKGLMADIKNFFFE